MTGIRAARMTLVVMVVLVATTGCSTQARTPGDTVPDATPFRSIPIPERENGYGSFESMLVSSQQEFDALVDEPFPGGGWNARAEFVAALQDANVDFDTEVLALLRHTEGSGSVPVALSEPVIDGRTLIVETRGRPVPIGTADMAFYCYAFAISRSRVDSLEFTQFSGSQNSTIPAQVFAVPD